MRTLFLCKHHLSHVLQYMQAVRPSVGGFRRATFRFISIPTRRISKRLLTESLCSLSCRRHDKDSLTIVQFQTFKTMEMNQNSTQEQPAQQIVTDTQPTISESAAEHQSSLSENNPRYNRGETDAIVNYLTKEGLFDPEYILLIIGCRQNAICVTSCLSDGGKLPIRICMSARGATSNRIIPRFSTTPISRVCCFTARIASIFDGRNGLAISQRPIAMQNPISTRSNRWQIC